MGCAAGLAGDRRQDEELTVMDMNIGGIARLGRCCAITSGIWSVTVVKAMDRPILCQRVDLLGGGGSRRNGFVCVQECS
jgi:hypothetical protein